MRDKTFWQVFLRGEKVGLALGTPPWEDGSPTGLRRVVKYR
jgi:hypothetical protein